MKSKMYNGIVVKVTSEYIVMLCKDGNFKNIPRSKNEVPKIGQPFTYTEKQKNFFSATKYLSLVSVVFLAIIGHYMISLMESDESYLFAVDINPSIEIYTDEHLRVTNIHFLNDDGKLVVDSIRNKKKDIHAILEDVINIAVEKNYLTNNEDNIVALTIVPLSNNPKLKDKDIQRNIEQSLKTNSVTAGVSVKNGSKKLVDEARKVNLSINKYQLYKEFKAKGINISIDEFRVKSITNMLGNIRLIKNDFIDEQKEKVTQQPNNGNDSNSLIQETREKKKLVEKESGKPQEKRQNKQEKARQEETENSKQIINDNKETQEDSKQKIEEKDEDQENDDEEIEEDEDQENDDEEIEEDEDQESDDEEIEEDEDQESDDEEIEKDGN